MIRHFKLTVFILGFILAALVFIFAGSLYIDNCSYRSDCLVGGRARAAHTPIPTLIPATLQANDISFPYSSSVENCTVSAESLLSAWVSAGSPETQSFPFSDGNNVACQATFTDVQLLFTESNLWVPGALACSSCHKADLSSAASAQLDLSSYAGVLAGSHRSSGGSAGVDILGAGNWQQSRLYQVLFVLKLMPYGAPPDSLTQSGPTLLAGIPVSVANATPTETPAQSEPVLPNTPGGTGDAINLTGDPNAGKQIFLIRCLLCHGAEGKGNVLNPGSDDGTVPPLNPIDSTLVSQDYHTFAYNLDLFIQNGSRPAGLNPARLMPPWGTQNGLTQSQIADVIAYVIGLNK
jgi:mono/diheme cytochrome c family protein